MASYPVLYAGKVILEPSKSGIIHEAWLYPFKGMTTYVSQPGKHKSNMKMKIRPTEDL